MKKLFVIATLLLAGAGAWKLSKFQEFAPSPVKAAEKKAPAKFNATAAREMAQVADRVAQAKMPEVDVSNLSKEEVDAKLKDIDDQLADEALVERVNQNKLSEAELVEVRKLLHLRARYFSRRVQLALRKS